MAVKRATKEPTPEAELESYIDKRDPKHQKLFRALRAAVRKRLPTANELAYDYGHSVVISYSPTENGIDGVVAIAARDAGVFLYFNQGQNLPDPKKILLGSAKQTRFIEIEAASRLAHPDVKPLIAATIEQARVPLPSEGKGRLIIKSSSAKKRARRAPAK